MDLQSGPECQWQSRHWIPWLLPPSPVPLLHFHPPFISGSIWSTGNLQLEETLTFGMATVHVIYP